MIRIANGQGFWGDWLEAPVRLVEQGPIDYLILDYLAEVTMSILQKQRQADARLGYASDFPPLIGRLAEQLKKKNIKVIANAGGVNPVACAEKVRELAPELKVAVVTGDDVLARIDDFLARGYEMRDMDTGEPIAGIRDRILSANAYIGAFPLAEALATGADVVIAGRSTDTALALAPMVHRFGWGPEEWNKLAAGTIAGHIVECGAQCSGGNCQVDWQKIPDMANVGYPIIEAEADGSFVITKHAGTGGRVHSDTVKEQLLYELGNPKQYITPDCVADFTSIHLEDVGPDRVRVSGIRGAQRPPTLKLSISYSDGWKAIGTLVYSWPEALEKAQAADRIVRTRLENLGLHFDEIYTEFFGVNACLGGVAPVVNDPAEVQLRIGVRAAQKKPVDRFTRELIPLVLNGPPGATGFGDGRPPVREIVAYWSALIPRERDHNARGTIRMKIALSRVAHTRSGDKGDTANVGVIAYDERLYSALVRELTPEKVAQYFAGRVLGPVERFELPNLGALNFLLHEALGGGGTVTLRVDAQGKTYGAAMLAMQIELSEEEMAISLSH